MDFHAYISSLQYNVIIDFPIRAIPRIRVYCLEMNPEDGIFVASELVELPTLKDCLKAGKAACVSGRYPELPPNCEVENISYLVEGIEAVASMIVNWATEYQKVLGQPLFPSPRVMALLVVNQTLDMLTYKNGIFYFGTSQISMTVTINEPEEEYRPGIYL